MKILEKEKLLFALSSVDGFQIRNGNKSKIYGVSYHVTYCKVTSHAYGEIEVQNERSIKIHAGETLVVTSAEYFLVPDDMFGLCINRVMGAVSQLQIDTTFIDPGFEGQLRIAITNLGETSKIIQQSTSICKVIFFQESEDIDGSGISHNSSTVDDYLAQVRENVHTRKKTKINKKVRLYLFYVFLLTIGIATVELIMIVIFPNSLLLIQEANKVILPVYFALIVSPAATLIAKKIDN